MPVIPKRVSPDVRIDADQIRNVLLQEVVKRKVVEGDKVRGRGEVAGAGGVAAAALKKKQ